MDKIDKLAMLPLILVVVCIISQPANAETSVYVFDPNQSIVIRSGGIAGIQKTFSIAGQFRLTVDSGANVASFEIVDASLTDEIDSVYGQSLDELFNMTGLAGIVVDDTTIEFEGKTDDGTESDVHLKLSLSNGSAYLTGNTTPPPNTADMFFYDVNSVVIKKYAGGTGEPNDPYQIATAEDLMLLGETHEDYDKHFILTAEIELDPDLPGRKIFGKAVIGPAGSPFTGVFDGKMHTISHLTIEGKDYVGLFGRLSGEVKNVGVVDVNTTGSRDYVGGLVGENYYGNVTNCYSTGVVSSTGSSVGSLVGYNEGTVTGCNCNGTVTGGTHSVGGLVGFNVGTVTDCQSTGSVSGTGAWVGGLVGVNGGTVTDCYSTGVVSSTGSGVGGLVGHNWQGPVTRCSSSGAVNGHHSVGGLVGFNEDAVTECFSIGIVSGTGPGIGGLVGDNGGTVTDCYSTGTVSSSSHNIGGLMGYNEGAVANCYSTGTVTGGTHSVGGLVGFNVSTVTASFWDTQTSSQAWSDGGTGKTTTQMQTANTFLNAGWDFVDETANGIEDIWKITEDIDYPRLWWQKYRGGTGEFNDPYQIATAEELILLGETPEDYDMNFILTADIDLDPNLPSRKVFGRAIIAPDINGVNDGFQGIPFTGVFDGNGHRILNFNCHSNSMEKIGLFGYLDHGSLIKDLGLENVNVTGFYEVGSLAGVNDGSVVNCYSTGFVGGGSDVGGLIGYLSGLVFSCYSTCKVSGESEIGGLVGDSDHGSVINCYSTGDVNGISEVGGLMGLNEGEITNCYSTSITSGKTQVGGLVGSNDFSISQVINSYSTGLVNGESYVGGLVGLNIYGFVTNSFWDTQTSGQTTSDGGTGLTTAELQNIDTYLNSGWDFVDETFNGTNDFWQLTTGNYPRLRYFIGDKPTMPEGTGTTQEPYLIRDARDLGTIWYKPLAHYRLEESVDLSGITWSMAVVPWFGGTLDGKGNIISNLHIQGSGYLGLFGQLESRAVISNLSMEAVDVNGIGSYVGGIVSRNDGRISTSYCTGTITGYDNVGGLAGKNRGNIDDSYSKAIVSGDWYVGGLVGDNRSSISTSFSTGLVSGNEEIGGLGGLVGFNWDGTMDECFWDMQTSGQTTSAGGKGKTTTEMQTASTFLEAGWDFIGETDNGTEDIWWILEGQAYPRLWWELSD